MQFSRTQVTYHEPIVRQAGKERKWRVGGNGTVLVLVTCLAFWLTWLISTYSSGSAVTSPPPPHHLPRIRGTHLFIHLLPHSHSAQACGSRLFSKTARVYSEND